MRHALLPCLLSALVTLTACAADPARHPATPGATGPVAAASAAAVANAQQNQGHPEVLVRTGVLALFGSELEAWWGLRQAQGGVIRLQMTAQEFAACRTWQNQRVEVQGVLRPPFLGTPVMQLQKIRAAGQD